MGKKKRTPKPKKAAKKSTKKKAAPRGPQPSVAGEDAREPEGGPLSRMESFMEERTARPRTKDDDDAPPPNAAIRDVAAAAAAAAPEEEEAAVPSTFRQDRMREYRDRQKKRLREKSADEDEDEGRPGRPVRGARGAAPPAPPVPPPSNNWIPIGPSVIRKGQLTTQAAVSGRVPGLAIVPGGATVYAATANGGVWRSDNAGRSWLSLMEAFDLNPTTNASDTQACGAIAIDPSDPDRVYVGTGEGDTVFLRSGVFLGNSAFFGVGPIRTDNGLDSGGAVNWIPEPSSPSLAGSAFYALAIDPGDRERVVAATVLGLYRREPDGSGGVIWQRKQTGPFTSVVAARSGSTTSFYAAAHSGNVFRSTNGNTWNIVGTGFPTSNVGRIGLAVQPDDPDTVYALIARDNDFKIRGVWRLDDATSGGTWRQVTSHPTDLFGTGSFGQGGYDLAIVVDPSNVDRIYLGGSTRDAGLSSGDTWSGSMYRATVASSGSGSSLTYSMSETPIGAQVHADIHSLVIEPGDPNNLWVGCDGGVFVTDDAATSDTFEPRNTGLSTICCEHLGLHPSQGAVALVGTQDNGTVRYTGEEAWLHMAPGDGGFCVVNWNDPYKMLVTYPSTIVRRFTDGGTRYNYTNVHLTPPGGEAALFYSPLVGTPPNPAEPAEAERVAIGTTRPWISETFGGGWSSIPNGTISDRLEPALSTPAQRRRFRIRSMVFAAHNKLYVGTMNGRVYRYDEDASGWTRTRLDNLGGTSTLPATFALPVTDIVVDPADSDGDSIYISFGGQASDYRRVWRFDGSQWEQRSGPSATSPTSLIDVQFNALIIDPANDQHIYAAADIGAWSSTDGGGNWNTFSEGLPDSAVFDMKIVTLSTGERLLRASTHGRGVYERTLPDTDRQGVELYVRDTQLDEGRFTTINGLPDPADQGETVRHWRGPDIKIDTPDASGNYQFPPGSTIDFFDYVDTLTDDSRNVATHVVEDIVSRVYVQVHNRGVVPANGVRVMCLLANASAGLPALPTGYDANVRSGTPISSADWETVGIATLDDVRVGAPKIAGFNLDSSRLPPPAALAGNDHHCVLALVHHDDDQYTSVITNTDNNSKQERKAAHKNLKVVEFTGTTPPAAPLFVPVLLHNPADSDELISRLVIRANGYSGGIRLMLTPFRTVGSLGRNLSGLESTDDRQVFSSWAQAHIRDINRNLRSPRPFHKRWSQQRISACEQAAQSGLMFTISDKKEAVIKRIRIAAGESHTAFLMFNRASRSRIGDSHEIELLQFDHEKDELIGGLTSRIDIVQEPPSLQFHLEASSSVFRTRFKRIRATLLDGAGRRITPQDGASVRLVVRERRQPPRDLGLMEWNNRLNSFVYIVPIAQTLSAEMTAHVGRREVATAKIDRV